MQKQNFSTIYQLTFQNQLPAKTMHCWSLVVDVEPPKSDIDVNGSWQNLAPDGRQLWKLLTKSSGKDLSVEDFEINWSITHEIGDRKYPLFSQMGQMAAAGVRHETHDL